MKYIVLPLTFLLLLQGIFAFLSGNQVSSTQPVRNITMCASAGTEQIRPSISGKFIVPLPGWGTYSYPISSKHDSARFYFNQGLNMYYSYHMKEALGSFKEAARFDPGNAMTYWGQALAMGPYYNSAHTYAVPAGIDEVIKSMNANAGTATIKEKDLIQAMNTRYPTANAVYDVKELNTTYALSMRHLVDVHPGDPDLKTLYIDAIMLLHAWDFWNQDGTAKAWTKDVVDMCAEVLKQFPEHPAALHYYIHLTEASRHPEVALPNADALKKLLPGVAHMVHMSSHEYQRNGLYDEGVTVNDKADDNLGIYESLVKNIPLGRHSPHYFAVQSYCALSGGMYKTGMQAALRCRNSVVPTHDLTYDQYLFMIPVLTEMRLGKWQEILTDSIQPDADWPYAGLLMDFAKGMAYLNTGVPDLARKHLKQLQIKMKDPVLTKKRIPFNAPVQMARIAEHILQGALYFAEQKNQLGIESLNKAIAVEDQLIYTEPNDWPIPARQFLGAYLMKINRPAQAEEVYREDLMWNPANGWSLLGLYQSLNAQHKTRGLESVRRKYIQAFAHADIKPVASAFIR